MIDNQDQVERLLHNLTEELTPSLMTDLQGRSSAAKITRDCKVTDVFYTGDEGGAMGLVIFDEEEKAQMFLVSITRLAFDRRLSIAREIAAYQKRRIKRLRCETATDAPAAYH
jgi:hypothetical protein